MSVLPIPVKFLTHTGLNCRKAERQPVNCYNYLTEDAMKRLTAGLTAFISCCLFTVLACSAEPLPPINVNENGIALKGYDPVAYFTEARPVKGVAEYHYEWNQARWLFSSEKHLTLFRENPAKYAPQYGGY